MNAIIPLSDSPSPQSIVGAVADSFARSNIFADYLDRKAKNTLHRQLGDLTLFARYLVDVKFYTDKEAVGLGKQLQEDAAEWTNITYGLVSGFVRWQLAQGYAVGSVNVRLATIKSYAKLAFQSGTLPLEQQALIATVKGYATNEIPRINEKRTDAGTPTRIGTKKGGIVFLSPAQVRALKTQPDTPQGRRDTLLICLLFDHGLRCGEIAALEVKAFNLDSGQFTFYRSKVDKTQTHAMSRDTLAAAQAWFANDALTEGKLLRASAKGGKLMQTGMSERAITGRVAELGKRLDIDHLSAHDGRHTWATRAAQNGTPINHLKDAGGWASLVMPLRYIESAKIANEGVNLGAD